MIRFYIIKLERLEVDNMKKISIIVPVYNCSEYLEKCLNSLVNQTYKDFEIILIDDGSTDDSLYICKKYSKKYSDIVLITQQNSGQGKARNKGINFAKGHYVTFVDSDDWIDKKMLQKLYNASNDGTADIVIGDLTKVMDKKNIYFKNYNEILNNPTRNFIISHTGPVCKLIKTSLLKDNNLLFLENRIYEDLALMPLIGLYIKKVKYVNEALYYYRIRNNSTMKSNKKLDDIFIVMDYLEKKFGVLDKEKEYAEELEYLFIEHLLYSASLRYINLLEYSNKIDKIVDVINTKYHNWKENKIYKRKSIKFKLVINLIYKKKYKLLKIVKKLRNNL